MFSKKQNRENNCAGTLSCTNDAMQTGSIQDSPDSTLHQTADLKNSCTDTSCSNSAENAGTFSSSIGSGIKESIVGDNKCNGGPFCDNTATNTANLDSSDHSNINNAIVQKSNLSQFKLHQHGI